MATQNNNRGMLRLFVSHSWAHSHHRQDFHKLLTPWQRGVDYDDFSISRQHPLDTETNLELAQELSARIRVADVLLIMAGMYAQHSRWMDREIAMAVAHGVPAIPIIYHGQERKPLQVIAFASCPPVHWRWKSITNAIVAHLPDERRAEIRAAHAARKFWAKPIAHSLDIPPPLVAGPPRALPGSPFASPIAEALRATPAAPLGLLGFGGPFDVD